MLASRMALEYRAKCSTSTVPERCAHGWPRWTGCT
jgi:hypothetical protein